MVTREQVLAILMFSGAVVSVVATAYMLYTSFQEIQALKAQDAALRKYITRIVTEG